MKVELLESRAITELISGYWRVSVLDEITSTQTELKNSNPKKWDLITAEFQSAGRGRLNRSFEAPKSSALLFSFYIEPDRDKNDWGFIPLLAGYVLTKTVNNLTRSNTYSCKWPNDLLAGEKKIAGLLAETHGAGVIVGIGINTTIKESDLPTETASSIFLESNLILNRNLLLANFCNVFENEFSEWDKGKDFIDEYHSVSATINRKVKVVQQSGEKNGLAVGVTKGGSLIMADGEEITIGDLIHLRD